MMGSRKRIHVAGITDAGLHRELNEDAFYAAGTRVDSCGRYRFLVDRIIEMPTSFVVADGVGGEIGGAEASSIVVQSFESQLDWKSALQRASREMYDYGRKHAEFQRMASTAAGVIIDDTEIIAFCAGDALVAHLPGMFSEPLAGVYSGPASSNVVDVVIDGTGERLERISCARLSLADRRIVLATDGVTHVLTQDEFDRCLQCDHPLQAVDEISDAVRGAGAPDNFTVLCVDLTQQ